jgi:hypothetical protein
MSVMFLLTVLGSSWVSWVDGRLHERNHWVSKSRLAAMSSPVATKIP